MVEHSDRVIVIGGANMDLSGTPEADLKPGDSNPGTVRMSPGGVGRNIAENLCRLGRPVSLITITGDDSYGQLIIRQCEALGMDVSMSLTVPEGRTSTYLCVNKRNGDLHAAVADMAVYAQLTPEKLAPLLPSLNQAALVIVDANLPEETLRWLGEQVTAPLVADPVSTAKALRLRGLLPRLEMLKPNIPEAELLTGISVRSDTDFLRVTTALRAFGVRRVFLSLGKRGVWVDDGHHQALLPAFTGPVRNTTGCGDAFLAAAADAWLTGADIVACAWKALAAAALCAADLHAVSTAMCREALDQKLSAHALYGLTFSSPSKEF